MFCGDCFQLENNFKIHMINRKQKMFAKNEY